VLRQDSIKINKTGSITIKSRKHSNDVGLQLQNSYSYKTQRNIGEQGQTTTNMKLSRLVAIDYASYCKISCTPPKKPTSSWRTDRFSFYVVFWWRFIHTVVVLKMLWTWITHGTIIKMNYYLLVGKVSDRFVSVRMLYALTKQNSIKLPF